MLESNVVPIIISSLANCLPKFLRFIPRIVSSRNERKAFFLNLGNKFAKTRFLQFSFFWVKIVIYLFIY